MFLLKNIIKEILLILISCLLAGCANNPEIPMNDNTNEVEKTDSYSYVATNETYGLALPESEVFRNILLDFIYWEYATQIERDKEGGTSIVGILEEENCLEKELKMNLYYRECDIEDMDEAESNIYNIIITFPEDKQLSYFSFYYNARGLSSDYDYGYDGGWVSDELDDDISSWKLMKNKQFQKKYTAFGESSLTIKKAEAEEYKVTNKFPAGEKEEILTAIQKCINKKYKDERDVIIYVRDFLPGDQSLSGEVVYLDIKDKNDIPLFWIRSTICYSGAKMDKFEDIYWDTHYSTAYSGAGTPNYDPTAKQVREWAKEEAEAIDAGKCILAFHIKDGEITELK